MLLNHLSRRTAWTIEPLRRLKIGITIARDPCGFVGRLAGFKQLTGAWFAGEDELYIAESGEDGSTTAIKKMNPKGETATDICLLVLTAEQIIYVIELNVAASSTGQ